MIHRKLTLLSKRSRVAPLLLLAGVLLAGCGGTPPRAPVLERETGVIGAPSGGSTTQKPAAVASKPQAVKPAAEARAETYAVRRGDTLYGIALDNGLDYRELAEWNGIANPNVIREGQVLRLQAPAGVQTRPVTSPGSVVAQPLGSPAASSDAVKTEPRAIRLPYSEENLALLTKPGAAKPAPPVVAAAPKPEAVKPEAVKPEAVKPEAPKPAPQAAEGDDESVEWGWPAGGRVVAGFSDPSNKGVDIAGKKGEPVFASASGRVVYIGEGLRGYGKLVIVKHNNTYLSAYAHNDTILVKEQQSVVKGQKIAEIGSTGTDATKLHFEIRRQGKPVDPMRYLPSRP